VLPVYEQASINGCPHFFRKVSPTYVCNLIGRSLKMDRWKLKELYQMELGGNKAALEYYTQHDMIRDGKPDHESAPHARYKHDLSAKAEAMIKAQAP